MMALGPYEPFRYLNNLRREMDRFLDFPGSRHYPDLRIDVYETEKEIIASCEIPGLREKDDVSIDIRENVLELRGTIKREHEIQEEHMHRSERFTGNFHRSVSLPGTVVAEASKARYKNGILEIRMPKTDPDTRRARVDIDFH